MNITETAQAVSLASNLVATGGGFNPSTLTVLGGVLLSHFTTPVAEKIPASVRPYAIGAGHIALGALATSQATGTPFAANLGTGLAAAGTAALYHSALYKKDSFLANILKGMFAPKQ